MCLCDFVICTLCARVYVRVFLQLFVYVRSFVCVYVFICWRDFVDVRVAVHVDFSWTWPRHLQRNAVGASGVTCRVVSLVAAY
jgi:hypothetical protein